MDLRYGFQIGMSGADSECNHVTFGGRKGNWKLRAMQDRDEGL